MAGLQIRVIPDSAPILDALAELSTLAKSFPEAVQRFLDGLLDRSELVRVHSIDGPAEPAGDLRILLEPSDRLREFLAAARAGNID